MANASTFNYTFYNLTELYEIVYNVFNEAKNEIMDDLKVIYQELKENNRGGI